MYIYLFYKNMFAIWQTKQMINNWYVTKVALGKLDQYNYTLLCTILHI